MLNIFVELFPPLKFPNGDKTRQMNVEQHLNIGDLLERLKDEGVFDDYGCNALLVMVDDQIAENNYLLNNGQVVKILLHVAGG
ncbi:MoaD/ThiS family protein [Petroclostridium sp. X23]|uniref:MoaD/ThiS family protein n=1 Tax=Petroclostridium sp. X23 TaxID=3045146 RepID=UPI0024AE0AAC|nr:MoaD/ThiS family protein [Petroclostridium sp. X23]WHH59280.1 MoaD/ThiS family protein [Petroclostridium sp. X23]